MFVDNVWWLKCQYIRDTNIKKEHKHLDKDLVKSVVQTCTGYPNSSCNSCIGITLNIFTSININRYPVPVPVSAKTAEWVLAVLALRLEQQCLHVAAVNISSILLPSVYLQAVQVLFVHTAAVHISSVLVACVCVSFVFVTGVYLSTYTCILFHL